MSSNLLSQKEMDDIINQVPEEWITNPMDLQNIPIENLFSESDLNEAEKESAQSQNPALPCREIKIRPFNACRSYSKMKYLFYIPIFNSIGVDMVGLIGVKHVETYQMVEMKPVSQILYQNSNTHDADDHSMWMRRMARLRQRKLAIESRKTKAKQEYAER